MTCLRIIIISRCSPQLPVKYQYYIYLTRPLEFAQLDSNVFVSKMLGLCGEGLQNIQPLSGNVHHLLTYGRAELVFLLQTDIYIYDSNDFKT